MAWFLIEVDKKEDVNMFKHVYPVKLSAPPVGKKTIIVNPPLNGFGGNPVKFEEVVTE